MLANPDTCPQTHVSHAGSSKSTHRITCVVRGTLLYEEPQSVFGSRGHEAPGFEDKIFKYGSHQRAPIPDLPNRFLTNQQAL